ncbi:MAG TPA: hypothetical protein VJ302_32790, partial [Blastocatellia bacterium]|nr:hypothetical protein [Blastocatellia bacterium]
MDKAPEQPEAPQSALAERLMRRRTEPIGVVDVRQPQMLYTRTAGWVAQRFGLLDRWRERYGADEQSWQRGDELVFASPALPSSDLAEAAPREPAVRRSAIPPSSGIAPSPGVASAPLLRVSRRRSNRTVVARTAEPSGGIADASGADGGVESVQRVRTAESAGPEETAHSTAPMVFRQRDEGRIESSPEPSTGEPSSLFAPTRAAENFVSTGAAPPTGRLLDRRMADPGPAASAPAAISATPPVLARSRELDWPGAPSAEARVWRTGPRSGLQAAPAGSMAPAARLELRRESETAASQVGGQVESTGPSAVSAEAPLPLAPALPVVQRRFEVEGIETGAAAPRTSPTASAIESPR